VFKSVLSFLFKDFKWKLLSLGLACILWLVGMYVNNPPSVEPFTRFLAVSNIDALSRDGIVLLNEQELRSEQITVNIRAPQSELAVLSRNTENIEASIDLRHINPEAVLEAIAESDAPLTLAMDVFVDMPENYERISTRPRTVSVQLDRFVRQAFEVRVIQEGEVRAGYDLMSLESVNKTVIVSGARSLVEQIYAVECRLNVGDATERFEQSAYIVAVDSHGRNITHMPGLEFSVRETMVSADIRPYKQVPLAITYTGELAAGYTVTGLSIEPDVITVAGSYDMLAELDTLHLEPLDLTRAATSQTFAIPIARSLPPGLALRESYALTNATIIVIIEPLLTRDFIFPVGEVQVFGFPLGAVQLANNEPIRLSVIGAQTDMTALEREQIRVSVNLMGLEEGEQSVPLTVSLPHGITLSGQPPYLEVVLSTPDPDEHIEMPDEPQPLPNAPYESNERPDDEDGDGDEDEENTYEDIPQGDSGDEDDDEPDDGGLLPSQGSHLDAPDTNSDAND
jgi:YbbR domain-containing protein